MMENIIGEFFYVVIEVLIFIVVWCDDLEKALQCPICKSCPPDGLSIFQCITGHIVCQRCMLQRTKCPICSQGWSSSRNRLAEDLNSMLSKMKDLLISPEFDIQRLFLPKTRSIRTQTEKPDFSNKISIKKETRTQKNTPENVNTVVQTVKAVEMDQKKMNHMSCPVGNCNGKDIHNSNIIDHFLKEHGIPCLMVPNSPQKWMRGVDSFTFRHNWEVVYDKKKVEFCRIFSWMNRTFYVQLYTIPNCKEESLMIAYAKVVPQSRTNSSIKDFSCELSIQCCIKHEKYKTQHNGAWLENMFGGSLSGMLALDYEKIEPMLHTQFLTCSLTIVLSY